MIWQSLSKSIGFEVSFCLQPAADWIDRKNTSEEAELFKTVQLAKNKIIPQIADPNVYQSYASAIEAFCSAHQISYLDLNTPNISENEWFFVDQVHLTDSGSLKVAEFIRSYVLEAAK